ncbi:MAG: YhdP family protein, partial [Thiohalomonadales bacterium]
QGLSGILQVNDNARSLLVSSNDLRLDIPGIFENRLNLGTVNAEVNWNINDSDIDVDIEQASILNSDAHLVGNFTLDWPLDNRPAMVDMRIDIKSAKGNHIYKYLPHKILSTSVNRWLKKAFQKANITRGTAVLKGPIREFPFQGGNGEFKVSFHLANGILNYVDQWPLIRNIEANVLFDSSNMLVNVSQATVLNSEISNATIEVPDMEAEVAKILIDGSVTGDTQDKIDYLISSPPLKKMFGQSLNIIKVSGESDLSLQIDLTLDDENTVEVTGALDLDNNNLEIKGVGDTLSDTNGRIELLKKGVNAVDIKTKIFGESARIDISTESLLEEGQRDDFVLLHATSKFQTAELSKRFVPIMQDLWTGEAPIDIKIVIPLNKYDRNIRADKGVDIVLDTFLEGVEIRLPKPYNKTAQEKLHLVSKITLAENNRIWYRTRYGGRLDSVIEYNETEGVSGDEGPITGEIRFGSGVAVLPAEPGIRLVGVLDELRVDVWKSLLGQFELKTDNVSTPNSPVQSRRSKTKSIAWSSMVHSADVTVKQFSAWGQHAQDVHLIITKVANKLHAKLDSDSIKGVVSIPLDLGHEPIKMEFDYINLNTNESEFGGGVIDPRDIPSIQARSKSVNYGNRKFGSVELGITSLAEGIRIEKIMAQPQATKITGRGKWTMVKGQPHSEIEFQLISTNLGETMTALGYFNSIDDGNGKVDVKLAWPGGLTEPNIEQLDGEVHFSLLDGQLLEYDPLGNTRLLGLFSIQTLPRRLFLDFSDLVGKGLKFDSIAADVTVEEGNAYTTNFNMQGPTIGAKISGRIGLAAQDYDQLVQVQLKFSDMISFVGLLIVSPWAVIIPQLLKKQFDKATQFEYSLTGRWSNPILEPIIPLETLDDSDVGGE